MESWWTGESNEYACTYQQRKVYVCLGWQYLYRQSQWKHDDAREMKRILPLLIALCLSSVSSTAQEMHIEGFGKVKKGPLNMNHVVVNKQQAIIDLKTSEKGFAFLADGKVEIQADEGDGVLTLKTPDKTAFIVVKHPDYGQLTWKVPMKKGLRRKKHYAANLLTFSPDKEYKLQKQWVIFEIQPQDAILTIDSTMTLVQGGREQFYLPIGKHAYLAESPFHQQEEGSFELTDEERQIVTVALQPIYSYLTVRTPLEGCDILVDGQHIGQTRGTSGHLREGLHRLTVLKDSLRYYDADFSIGWREKKTIELTMDDLRPVSRETGRRVNKETEDDISLADSVGPSLKLITAPVTIKALDDNTSIWVNRELKGYGSWEGELSEGFYLISTEKDGLESRSTTLWVDDDKPKNIELLAPMGSYGMINVHSNEIGADVYINGKLAGKTPCVVKNLPSGSNCQVRLVKAGYYEAEKEVQIVGNDLTDIKLKLKKRR